MADRFRLCGVLWSVTYLVLVAFPLVVLLLGDSPRGGGYRWDFAMGLGFGGLAMMGLQAVLTARFRRARRPSAWTSSTIFIGGPRSRRS